MSFNKIDSKKENIFSIMELQRKEIGLEFFRILWVRIAEQVVDKAILVYELDAKQADALKKTFLKPNHYYAISK